MNKNRRVIALGFFDGVHNGHGALLRRVVDKARELDAVAAAFTFDRSPTAATIKMAISVTMAPRARMEVKAS